jgi:hypothetical protein
MRKELVAHGLAAIGVAATLTVFFLLVPVSPGTGSSTLPASGFTTTTAGLELHLSLNSTSVASGDPVSVSIWMYNPSASEVDASYSGNWAVQGMGVGPCGTGSYPMGISIMRGNLTLNQVKGGPALQLYGSGEYGCPMILFYVQSYNFSPASSFATLMGYCSPSSCMTENITASMSFSGEYTASGFTSFAPGVYTFVGGDEWGGLTLLHFVVST